MSSGQIFRFGTGTLGVDKTGAAIPESSARQLYNLGYRFALRSIGVPTSPTSQEGQLTTSELQGLWSANVAVSVFQLNFLQATITGAQGTLDGQYLANQAMALGLPTGQGFTLWFDLEGGMDNGGKSPPPSSENLLSYLDDWASALAAAGYAAGLYVGDNTTLDTLKISNLPGFHAYWQAGQLLYVGMPARGFQMYQLYPPAQTIGGVVVDVDIVQSDFQGSQVPFWGPAPSTTK